MALWGDIAEILNKTRLPVVNIVLPDRRHHFSMAGNTFRERHGQRAVQGIRHVIAIVRVHNQRRGKLICGPGKLG